MKNTVVLDLFLGDSGKGKVVDNLLANEEYNHCVRFNGANNAGHTIVIDKNKFKVHGLPTGILHSNVTNWIAGNCAINIDELSNELEKLNINSSKLVISPNTTVIESKHVNLDTETENANKGVGSTRKGVAYAISDRYARKGKRIKDISGNTLSTHIDDFFEENLSQVAEKGGVLFEHAQGFYLDPVYGDYPFVTSSHCGIGAVMLGTGVNHKQIDEVIGVVKAYGSYVGTNPNFPDIKEKDLAEAIIEIGNEYGTTTGRKRRVCWLDLDLINKAIQLNGVDSMIVNCIDVLEQLPKYYLKHNEIFHEFTNIDNFCNYLECHLNAPLIAIGIGPERNDFVWLNEVY